MNFRALLQKCILATALLALIIGVGLPSAVVHAQQAVTLDSVRVDVWPEYDQPSVLVIYNVTLDASVSLPAALTLRIPAAAAKPHAVAMLDANRLYDLQYTLGGAGDWIEVRMTTPTPQVRVEYYDPSLAKDGDTRSFAFTWSANYTVKNFSVVVQQPLNASEISFRPAIGEGRVNSEDGLTYYSLVTGEVPASQPLTLEMTYDKPDDTLTQPQQFQPAVPNQPVDADTTGRVTLLEGFSMTPLQLVMLGVGMLLIIGGLAWYLITARSGKAEALADGRGPGRHSGRKRHSAAQGEPLAAGEAAYCSQCGKKAAAGDAFCRACGTRLR